MWCTHIDDFSMQKKKPQGIPRTNNKHTTDYNYRIVPTIAQAAASPDNIRTTCQYYSERG